MIKNKGFTLIEVIVSLVILFFISVFIMSLFVTGSTALQRSKNFTTAFFLAQEKMEELIYQEEVLPETGAFTGEFSGYSYQIQINSYSSILKTVEVDVFGPRGVRAHFVCLKKVPLEHVGVTIDKFSNTAFLSKQLNKSINYHNGESLSFLSNLPDNGIPSGIAVDGYSNVVWVGDRKNKCIWYYSNGTYSGPFRPSSGMGIPTGLATDFYSNIVWVGDRTNKCLWYYIQSSDTWSDQIKPTSAPFLGEPQGVATDPYGSTVWVADFTNNCIRFYNDETDTWSDTLYRTYSLNGPTGVAVSGSGDIVYVVDNSRLWKYDSNTNNWSSILDLPAGMGRASGLSVDTSSDTFWVNDLERRLLWYGKSSGWSAPISIP